MVNERYLKNMDSFSEKELSILSHKKVAVVGCGGLGGYVIEILGRFGIGYLKIIDGDVFAISNLNRQVFALESSLGKNKAVFTKKTMKDINKEIEVVAIEEMLEEGNGEVHLEKMDLVVDCLDNINTRLLLQQFCKKLNIPLVHGAIGGFYGQVTTIFPGDDTLDFLYKKDQVGIEKKMGNPSFIPALVASIECSEVLKCLVDKGELLRKKVLRIDSLNNEFEVLDFSL